MLLKTQNVSVTFGGVRAVDSVNFNVPNGEVRALIGPNGAGKTTFFNILSGRIPPSVGSIVFDGVNITGMPPRKIVRLGLVRTFQISSIFPGLTVFENVWAACNSSHSLFETVLSPATRRSISMKVEVILETLKIQSLAKRTASELSYGDQRVAEIAIALGLRPKLLLLDEPTAGMSPTETRRVVELIERLRNDLTIVIVEHDMELIMSLADKISVFDRGRLLVEGSPAEIRANEEVRNIYLGTVTC
jgi:branched-chain amino acid transport system ATP-binding protein